jgi:serine/threonine protein kinase
MELGLQVLLTACGRIKLCDFGICKVATEPAHLQSVMTVVGCNNYLPVSLLVSWSLGLLVSWSLDNLLLLDFQHVPACSASFPYTSNPSRPSIAGTHPWHRRL